MANVNVNREIQELWNKIRELEQRLETRFNTLKSEIDSLATTLEKIHELALKDSKCAEAFRQVGEKIEQLIRVFEEKKKRRWLW